MTPSQSFRVELPVALQQHSVVDASGHALHASENEVLDNLPACLRFMLLRDLYNNGTFASSAESFCRGAMEAVMVAKRTGDKVTETEFWRWVLALSRHATAPDCLVRLVDAEMRSRDRILRMRAFASSQAALAQNSTLPPQLGGALDLETNAMALLAHAEHAEDLTTGRTRMAPNAIHAAA
eukprot:CAMPEP_0176185984 /NCGR_PEP_ID=MMETSP0121_2-20121125/1634_1 /TAXON_ID=160619 /ORGANISM="Kryptoperidinium foliaceum, Strain CCMP 1326" /LENGTH=180 /DNA_ID=CAMNT_0017524451 /DNA_START=27 /DNA_END=570 /DNA_ORIENTATION=-